MGCCLKHELARGLLLHSQFCSYDGSREKWAHYQYLFTGRKEPAAQWGGVCGIQVGLEWLELFRSRRGARAQYSGFGCLPLPSRFRVEPACGEGLEDYATGCEWGSRC